ncbi:MAG: hypothetical protein WCJ69_09730 [Betaproteobacteria bacterium]|jgi:hypothetical protein
MCFEFEWLYWAQLAQEKAQRDEKAQREQAADAARVGALRQDPARRPRDMEAPAHA